jgi:WD40 repeat protein
VREWRCDISDGKQLVTAAGTIQTWDVSTGEQLRTFTAEGIGGFTDAVFSPDGKYIAAVGVFAVLWDAQSGAEVRRYVGHTELIQAVNFSPDGKYLVTASNDATVRLWEVQPSFTSPQFASHSDGESVAGAAAFSPDGKYLVTASNDNGLRLWDVATREIVRTFTGHTDSVSSVAFSPDDKWLLSGSSDNTVRLWDIAAGKEIREFTGLTKGPGTLAFSPDGKQVLATGEYGDYSVRIWNAQTAQATETITMTSFAVTGIMYAAYSPDDTYVVTTAPDPTYNTAFSDMVLINPATGRQLRTISSGLTSSQYADQIGAIAVSPDGKFILSSHDDKTVRLWNASNGQQVRSFVGHSVQAYFVGFSSDGKYVLTASSDGTARLWETATGRELRRFSNANGVGPVALSPDTKWLFTGNYDNTARLWQTDYHDAIKDLCSHLLRDFTPSERAQYEIKGDQPTCPKQ